ncbi:MAG TPA: hypothetical protein VHY48_11310 [Acidobacteriaceae bacterium]|jgi:uncharacterized membrane protein YagU involved in acid resistance|nr:hypothetical protein [Acidobacteriaceae bacterium]
MSRRAFVQALGLCLLIAGTLDIADALIFNGLRGVPAEGLLHFIAACLIGISAFHGGLTTAALGLAIHYAITLFWSALFLVAAARFTALTRHAIVSGLLYGGIIYIVMNYIVLPLARLPPRSHHHPTAVLINAVLALLLCMGLPIALIARRFARQ